MFFRLAFVFSELGVLVFGISGTIPPGTTDFNDNHNNLRVHNRTGILPSSTPACCQRSCEGLCGQHHSITESVGLKCNCDATCVVFGDCCHDYYSLCLSWSEADITDTKKSSGLIHKQLLAFEVPKEKDMTERLFEYKQCVATGNSEYFWMISSCPKSTSMSLSTLCEGESLKMFGSVPVSHTKFEEIVFRNIHCAKCHGLAASDVIIWISSAECPSAVDEESLENLEELSHLFEYKVCTMISKPPAGRPRACFEEDTNSPYLGLAYNKINSTFANSTEENITVSISSEQNSSVAHICYLCKAYHYRIVINSSLAFRNPHCMQCLLGNNSNEMMQCAVGVSYYGRNLPQCGPNFSCKDRCGRQYGVSECWCDVLCVIFGDCCFDYYSECLNSTLEETIKDGTLDNISSIISVPPKDPQYTVVQHLLQYRKYQQCVLYSEWASLWMISQCPASYENQIIVDKCFDAGLENIPFSHKRIQYVTFRNKYCAQCHNISTNDLEPWSSTVRCGSFTPDPLSSYQAFVESLLKMCVLSVSDYLHSNKERICLPHTPTEKPSNLCSFYQFPVINQRSHVLKNPHCSSECVRCLDNRNKHSDIENYGSISILFNFDSTRSDVTMSFTKEGQQIVLKSRITVCELDEVYNLFLESCTKLICPVGKTAVNGSCVIQGIHVVDKHSQLLPDGSKYVYIGMNVDNWDDIDVLQIWTSIKYRYIIEILYLLDLDLFMENINNNKYIVLDESRFLNRILKLNMNIIKSPDLSVKFYQNISEIGNLLQNDILSIKLSTDTESFLSRISSLLRNPKVMENQYGKMFLKHLTVVNYKVEENLTCTKGNLQKWLNPTFSIIDKTYYGNISNRYFSLNNVPFEITFNMSNSEPNIISILTCEISLNCEAVSYSKSQFEIHNNTLYILNSNRIIDSDNFILLNDTALVCSNFTRDYTYFESVKFFNFNPTQGLLTLVTSLISIVCSALTFIVYLMLPELRNVPGKLIMSLSLMLLLSQCLLMTIQLPTGRLCIAFAVITHTCWLSTFAWMTVIGINLAITFRVNASGSTVLRSRCIYRRYALFAWGVPLCIVLFSVGLDSVSIPNLSIGYGNGDVCWISNNTASLIIFGLPLAMLLGINIVCFLVTLYGIRKATEISKNISSTRNDRQTFPIYSKMFVITGLSWCFCFVAAFARIDAIWYAFIITNNLQGLYVFTGFACTSRIVSLLKKKYFTAETKFSNITPTTPAPDSSNVTRH